MGRKPKVAHNTHTRESEIRFYAGFEEVLLIGKSVATRAVRPYVLTRKWLLLSPFGPTNKMKKDRR